MQETLAHLFFWGHCPSLSSPLSFAPQGCSLSALTDHCRVSPPQVQDVPTLLPISWQVAGWRREDAKGAPSSSRGPAELSHPVPFPGMLPILWDKNHALVPRLGQGEQLWVPQRFGEQLVQGTDHPISTLHGQCLFSLGKGNLCWGKRGFIPCWVFKQNLLWDSEHLDCAQWDLGSSSWGLLKVSAQSQANPAPGCEAGPDTTAALAPRQGWQPSRDTGTYTDNLWQDNLFFLCENRL